MSLFDPNPYVNHPALWPPLSDDVMSDAQVAELIWPGVTSTPGPFQSMDVPLGWGEMTSEVQSWR